MNFRSLLFFLSGLALLSLSPAAHAASAGAAPAGGWNAAVRSEAAARAARGDAVPQTDMNEPRLSLALAENWKFNRGSADGAQAPGFDDRAWDSVRVPHTWNVGDGDDGGGYFRGDGWYRTRFSLPPGWSGKRIFVQFDGANRTAEVWLNGKRVGSHRGGFARFRFDLTELLDASDENVLAVRVSNAGHDNMAPVSGDFTFFGGLYREVSLLAVEPVHIDLMDHASPGVFIHQTQLSSELADLNVQVKLANDTGLAASVVVRSVILDAGGKQMESTEREVALPPWARGEVSARVLLPRPHFWNAQEDPYLYQVNTYVLSGGVVRDRVTLPLGLRTLAVDPALGFFLNGKYLDLHGVNRHQETEGKGWAISAADEDEDFSIIEEMGCTFVRQSHYQQSQHWNDLGDRRGMLMWAELAYVNDARDNPEFLENAKEQLRELIRQNFHHPAIVVWSIGNETFVRDKKVIPADTNDRILRALAAVAREEDPGRFSTYASNGDVTEPRAGITDVVGFNHYFGWYHGEPEEFATWLDKQHADRPDLRIGMSEFGAGANIAQHEEPARHPEARGQWHPEEWQSKYHEVYWQTLKTRPWVWSKLIWVMFDFASDGRNEGGTPGRNDKGLVTADRKVRKDAYYWYQANWSYRPVLHLTSKRFVDRKQPKTMVKVYSNATTVELLVNGVPAGRQNSANKIFVWPDVALTPGENRIEVRAMIDGVEQVDRCVWKLEG